MKYKGIGYVIKPIPQIGKISSANIGGYGRKKTLNLNTPYIIGKNSARIEVSWGDGTESTKSFTEKGESVAAQIQHDYGRPYDENENDYYIVYVKLYMNYGNMNLKILTDIKKIRVDF